MQNATEAVSQTRLDRQMMVGPLTLIRPKPPRTVPLVLATTLPETDLFCCVMEFDVGRRGNTITSRLRIEKTSWSGRGRLIDGNSQKARRSVSGNPGSVNAFDKAARDLLSLELAAPKKSLANGVFDWIVFYFWLYWPDGSNSANPWPRCGRQQ